jgi:hypothetical protein
MPQTGRGRWESHRDAPRMRNERQNPRRWDAGGFAIPRSNHAHPDPTYSAATPCPDVGSPALPTYPQIRTARCCTCAATPRSAARSATGAASGAGIQPTTHPGEPAVPTSMTPAPSLCGITLGNGTGMPGGSERLPTSPGLMPEWVQPDPHPPSGEHRRRRRTSAADGPGTGARRRPSRRPPGCPIPDARSRTDMRSAEQHGPSAPENVVLPRRKSVQRGRVCATPWPAVVRRLHVAASDGGSRTSITGDAPEQGLPA